MNIILVKLLETLRKRVRVESPELVEAIDALRESEKYLRMDDERNCHASLVNAQEALAKIGAIETAKPEPISSVPDRAILLDRGRALSQACRNQLRESSKDDQLIGPNKYVVLAVAAIIVSVFAAVATPYIRSGGKIAMARTQVYWVHYPEGLGESNSKFSPIRLDGEWHEIRINASDPMTAVRIDPATDSTVLNYYDIRNARVLWQDPDAGFEPELEQVHWGESGCVATNADGYLNVTEMGPDCNVMSMNFPAYYEVSEIVFEARSESRRLGILDWVSWTLGWRSINE